MTNNRPEGTTTATDQSDQRIKQLSAELQRIVGFHDAPEIDTAQAGGGRPDSEPNDRLRRRTVRRLLRIMLHRARIEEQLLKAAHPTKRRRRLGKSARRAPLGANHER